MAKIRTLKRAYFRSKSVCRMSRLARLTLAGVICCVADDEGRFLADARLIRTDAFPHDDDVTDQEIERHLVEASSKRVGLIKFYRFKGERYAFFPEWRTHQWISHLTPSTLPKPPAPEVSGVTPVSSGTLRTDARAAAPIKDGTRKGKGKEGNKEASPPITDRTDVLAVCQELQDSERRKGHRAPSITEAWKRAARLLIDRDGHSLAEIITAIRWVEQDSFWWKNIGSPEKLREKFDRLRDDMGDEQRTKREGPALPPPAIALVGADMADVEADPEAHRQLVASGARLAAISAERMPVNQEGRRG